MSHAEIGRQGSRSSFIDHAPEWTASRWSEKSGDTPDTGRIIVMAAHESLLSARVVCPQCRPPVNIDNAGLSDFGLESRAMRRFSLERPFREKSHASH
jgi:hypothetical protein